MKKLILIASLLMANGLYAEPKTCEVNADSTEEIRESIKKCWSGDILYWRTANFLNGVLISARYCDQEKQITVDSEFQKGVCTYTGKRLKTRTGEESWICGTTSKEFCPNESDKCVEQLRYNKFGKEQYCYQ